MKKEKILYVEWVDAAASNGWCRLENAVANFGVENCKSIGFLVYEDNEQVILAGSLSDAETNQRMAIPKAWIKKRRVVRL